ncbi:MAG TPA: hypothetical protein VFM63_00955, partial [Pyrinomonadaceae bacterium]|nr:hypothetical protein [Pyrinomonadaceae bacterium]
MSYKNLRWSLAVMSLCFLGRALPFSLCVLLASLSSCKTANLVQSQQVSPEVALKTFYENDGAEDTLM